MSTNAASTDDNKIDVNPILFETSDCASCRYMSSACTASVTVAAVLRHPSLVPCQRYSQLKIFHLHQNPWALDQLESIKMKLQT